MPATSGKPQLQVLLAACQALLLCQGRVGAGFAGALGSCPPLCGWHPPAGLPAPCDCPSPAAILPLPRPPPSLQAGSLPLTAGRDRAQQLPRRRAAAGPDRRGQRRQCGAVPAAARRRTLPPDLPALPGVIRQVGGGSGVCLDRPVGRHVVYCRDRLRALWLCQLAAIH